MTTKEQANLHKVLADEVRFKILNIIIKEGKISAKDILKQVCISQPTLSFHLQKLSRVKFITAKKQGQFVYYELNKVTADKVHKYMEIQLLNRTKIFFEKLSDKNMVGLFKLYSDPERIEIFKHICRHPQITGKELFIDFNHLANSTVSFHVKKLVESGIVTCRKIGNQRHYAINYELSNKIKEAVADHMQNIKKNK